MDQLVSVVIPFYKGIIWLNEAIASVIAQTYKNLEIILINDGSQEDISSILKKYNDRLIYIHKNNTGPGETRNIGIEISRGEYIAFLDSDDIWLPNKIEDQLYYMVANNLIWCHTAGRYFWEHTSKQKSFNFHKTSGDVSLRGFLSMRIATPSMIIKADILKNNINLRFNAKMRYSQDTFMYINMAQLYELGYFAQETVLIRMRSNQKGVEINAALQARLRFRGRSIMLQYMEDNKDTLFANGRIPTSIYLSHKYYYHMNKKLEKLEAFFSENNIEKLSKILYLFSYTYERIILLYMDNSKAWNKKKNKV